MRFLGALLTVGVLGLVTAGSAAACSCAYIPPEKQLREADGAVVARLLAVRPIDPNPDDEFITSSDPTDYVYRTGRVVKGGQRLRKGRRLVVRSVRDVASCGLSTRIGELSGLFLRRRNGRWRSDSCSQTTAGLMRRLGRSGDASAAAGPLCGA